MINESRPFIQRGAWLASVVKAANSRRTEASVTEERHAIAEVAEDAKMVQPHVKMRGKSVVSVKLS